MSSGEGDGSPDGWLWATMKAAVQALRKAGATRIVVAVPVGPPDTCRELEELADEVAALFRQR